MRRAFTLLEVLVALGILGISLLAIININAEAVSAHLYAKKLTIATLLAQSKMTDLEQTLHDKGLPADDDEDSGDFSEEGWPSYKWRARIVVPKTNGLSPEQLFGALFNLPLGAGDGKDGAGGLLGSMFGAGPGGMPGGMPGGLPGAPGQSGAGAGLLGMLGPMAGVAQGQFTQMVDQLQKSVREVHLTVTWKEGKTTESFDLVTHVVSLGPGSDRNGGAVAAAGGMAGATGEQWVRADNGLPVPNPRPAPNGVGMVDPTDGSPVITLSQFQAARGGMPGMPGMPGTFPGAFPGGIPRSLTTPGAGSILRLPSREKQGIFE